jgi:hypothetical protein
MIVKLPFWFSPSAIFNDGRVYRLLGGKSYLQLIF